MIQVNIRVSSRINFTFLVQEITVYDTVQCVANMNTSSSRQPSRLHLGFIVATCLRLFSRVCVLHVDFKFISCKMLVRFRRFCRTFVGRRHVGDGVAGGVLMDVWRFMAVYACVFVLVFYGILGFV